MKSFFPVIYKTKSRKNSDPKIALLYFAYENESWIGNFAIDNNIVTFENTGPRTLKFTLNLTEKTYIIENTFDDIDYDDTFKLYDETIIRKNLLKILENIEEKVSDINEISVVNENENENYDEYKYNKSVDEYEKLYNSLTTKSNNKPKHVEISKYNNVMMKYIIEGSTPSENSNSNIKVELLSDDGCVGDDEIENISDVSSYIPLDDLSDLDENEEQPPEIIHPKNKEQDILKQYYDISDEDESVESVENGEIEDTDNYFFDETIVKEHSLSIINADKSENKNDTNVMFSDTKHIVKIVINLIQKINEMDTDIKIMIKNNNIFTLTVKLFNMTGSQLLESYDNYKEKHPDFNNCIYFSINVPSVTYGRMPIIPDFDQTVLNDSFVYGVKMMDFFKEENWNPTHNLKYTIEKIREIINEKATLKIDSVNNITNNIINIEHLMGIVKDEEIFKIDFVKVYGLSQSIDKITKMASGTGFSSSSQKLWDSTEHASKIAKKQKLIDTNMKVISDSIDKNVDYDFNEYVIRFNDLIIAYYKDMSFTELDNYVTQHLTIAKVIQMLVLDSNFDNMQRTIISCVNNTIQLFKKYQAMNKNDTNNSDVDTICDIFMSLEEKINTLDTIVEKSDEEEEEKKSEFDIKNQSYIDSMKEYKFDSGPFTTWSLGTSTSGNNKKVMKEFMNLEKDLPIHYDSSVFVYYDEDNMNKIKFMIIGPKDTPYQDGCYLFDMLLPSNYPNTHPKVNFLTTGNGSVRFNPNLYNCGKVCLSLLGTWSGEKWTPESTMMQLLVSIQSLILIEEPYFNEPGYQNSYGSHEGTKRSEAYNKNIRKQNINWGIINALKNPAPEFESVIMKHFEHKRFDIMEMIDKWTKEDSTLEPLKSTLENLFNKL